MTDVGEKLLQAARAEQPSAAATKRALELVDPPGSPSLERIAADKRRSWMWTLGAAAMVVGILLFVFFRPVAETAMTSPVSVPTISPDPAATAVAQAPPAASATAAATASASAEPQAIAQQTKPRPAAPKPAAKPAARPKAKPKAKPPTGKCGCRADDIMCHMRCSQK